MKYTRTTISIPAHVLELGQRRAEQFRISFSEYLARLIEEEHRTQRSTMTLVAEEPPGSYAAGRTEIFHHELTPAELRKSRAKKKPRPGAAPKPAKPAK